jgi:hypothetical protein
MRAKIEMSLSREGDVGVYVEEEGLYLNQNQIEQVMLA